jgi:hypothetical protein
MKVTMPDGEILLLTKKQWIKTIKKWKKWSKKNNKKKN